jgi:hypothetical protein
MRAFVSPKASGLCEYRIANEGCRLHVSGPYWTPNFHQVQPHLMEVAQVPGHDQHSSDSFPDMSSGHQARRINQSSAFPNPRIEAGFGGHQ